MAISSISQDNKEEHPLLSENKALPLEYKELFYIGCFMCQLIDELYESLIVIDDSESRNGRSIFIGFQRSYSIMSTLTKIKKRWEEISKKMMLENI